MRTGFAPRSERWLLVRARCAAHDRACAIALQRAALARPPLLAALVAASRLGDGVVWVALMLALPAWGGPPGITCGLQMALLGLANLGLYYALKLPVARARPFAACADIRACTKAFDRYSFPSGHALHAVAYAIVLGYHYPAFLLPLAIGALAVAASRVVLGLHYPSDVLAGAALGATTASALLLTWP